MNFDRYVAEEHYDVVVCGSGPAGLGAALSAAHEGVRVMLLESANLPGGTINAVPWMPVNRIMLDGKDRSYAHSMLVKHIRAMGDVGYYEGKADHINGDGLSCHVEYSEMALYNMLDEAGVEYRSFSPVVGAIKEGNVLKGVVAREKRGMVAYYASAVVDATGDGDAAAAAGCEFMIGREDDGVHMPITLGFALGGIDRDVFIPWFRNQHGVGLGEDGGELKRILDDADKKGYYVAAWYDFNPGTVPGIVGVNNGAWRHQSLLSNALSSADLTMARRNGLHVAIDLPKIFKEYNVPGAQNCFLDKVGNILGVRDTRRIVGEDTQTFEDSQAAEDKPGTVARKYGWIDGNQVYQGPMRSGYGFPYMAMVPKGVDGILTAGRCASMTFMGHCAGKSMGNMMELGVAAGTAAAMCHKLSVTPRELPVEDLRRELIEVQGVRL